MKKLISRVLTVALVAGSICNVTLTREARFAEAAPRPVASVPKKENAEGKMHLKKLQVGTDAVVIAADQGASAQVLAEKRDKLEELQNNAESYLKRTKRVLTDMSMTQKAVLGAIAASGLVIASVYYLEGKDGYMHAALEKSSGYFQQAGDYLASVTPEFVKTGYGKVRGYLPSMSSINPRNWFGKSETAPVVDLSVGSDNDEL